MAIKLTAEWDNDSSVIDIPDDDVKAAAERHGWRAKMPDPGHARAVELKQAEFLSADPNSPERQFLAAELQSLQAQGGGEIDNPQTASDYAISVASDWIVGMFLDQQSIQAAAQAKANEDLAKAKAAIKAKLNLKK